MGVSTFENLIYCDIFKVHNRINPYCHMKYPVIILLSVLILSSCGRGDEMAQKEEWAGKPVSEWPELVFTNNIEFKDTTYTGIANSFLVDTGHDTVTCKHVFLVFRHEELLTIDLGDNFIEWRAYPKGNEDRHMVFGNMINKNSNEMVDRFNTLKVRDWLLFEVDDIPAGFTPLKIRTKPVQKDEIICDGAMLVEGDTVVEFTPHQSDVNVQEDAVHVPFL